MKYQKVDFSEAVKEFELHQFIQFCEFFGVDVIERESVKTALAAVGQDNEKDAVKEAFSGAKARRDFEQMSEELVEKYKAAGRPMRRKIDRIVAKICWGNRQARKIQRDRLVEQQRAAIEQKNSVIEQIAAQGEEQ